MPRLLRAGGNEYVRPPEQQVEQVEPSKRDTFRIDPGGGGFKRGGRGRPMPDTRLGYAVSFETKIYGSEGSTN